MSKSIHERFVSVDAFRGIVMFLLLAESVDLYWLLYLASPDHSVFQNLTHQFFHHEWNGMKFWSLMQPYFTFIVGVAMTLSLNKRWARGDSWLLTFNHVLYRCAVLFLLGIILQSGFRNELVWELWNILTQLSLSIFITFMIIRLPHSTKFIISICMLLITELLYRNFLVEGFNQPFLQHQNFGSSIDLLLMNKTHPDGWVAFNFIPNTAHMIWGVLVGSLLLNSHSKSLKVKILILSGIIGILIGYGMDAAGISPINKYISTSSFVIVSGGWCVITFALFYWVIELKKFKRWTQFFVVIGMNPIFIYVLSRILGRKWLYPFVAIFTTGIFGRFIDSEGVITLITCIVILTIEWYICYWLYKKKIFIKI